MFFFFVLLLLLPFGYVQLTQLGKLLSAADAWAVKLEDQLSELKSNETALRERVRSALANWRDNDRALKRMATAESNAAAVFRALGDRISASTDAARALCRQVQGANASLPAVDERGAAIGSNFATLTSTFDALLAEVPDDALTVEAQIAALDAKKARHAEQKRSLADVGARLLAFEKDVAAQRATVSAQQKELGTIASDQLSELTARLGELRGDIYQLEQWAAAYVERNVVVAPPDANQLQTKLDELKQYANGPLHEALDALALACARLESRASDLRDAERTAKGRERDAREADKQTARELKRVAKAQSEVRSSGGRSFCFFFCFFVVENANSSFTHHIDILAIPCRRNDKKSRKKRKRCAPRSEMRLRWQRRRTTRQNCRRRFPIFTLS